MEDTEVLYNKYCKKVFNLAFRMTGNKEDANDITQETFIQAFKSIDRFKGESQVYTWLYQIAKNNCLRFLEKKKKTTFLSLQKLLTMNSLPMSDEISETEKSYYIMQVKDGCLSGLLRCLSIHQRLAFILNILLEMPIEQVAGVIGKSENATRILVHRSRRNIKEFLCNNCSLYDSKNSCRCENMINFSVKQGWISKYSELKSNKRIETEIEDLKGVVELYKSLEEKTPGDNFSERFKGLLAGREDFMILNNKKMK